MSHDRNLYWTNGYGNLLQTDTAIAKCFPRPSGRDRWSFSVGFGKLTVQWSFCSAVRQLVYFTWHITIYAEFQTENCWCYEELCALFCMFIVKKWNVTVYHFWKCMGMCRLKIESVEWPTVIFTAASALFWWWFVSFQSALRFRFQQHGKKENSFCREFRLSSNYSISELIYNCGWLHKEYEGTVFGLEYEAYERTFREVRKYVFQIPLLEHIGKKRYTIKLLVSEHYLSVSDQNFQILCFRKRISIPKLIPNPSYPTSASVLCYISDRVLNEDECLLRCSTMW